MAFPSLFRADDRAELLARIDRVTPDCRARWGRMDAHRMLTHCGVSLRVALGDQALRWNLLGKVFGPFAKRTIASPRPWRKNLPTAAEFKIAPRADFATEARELAALLQRFGEGGPDGVTKEPHPFFGPLTPEEWNVLQWRHLDHHLQQFGR